MAGMGSHQSAGKAEKVWLTPPHIVESLGPFDLDPCFSAPRPWATAAVHYGLDAAGGLGGLFAEWKGFVWCNPPYGKLAEAWLEKCADHGNAIALIFARTETEAFFNQVWGRADAVFFIEGRITFMKPDGTKAPSNGGAPSVLVCYGANAVKRVESSGIRGKMVKLVESADDLSEGKR